MLNDLPTLSHQEQQKAVEKIQELMSQGVSTAEAIKIVSEKSEKRWRVHPESSMRYFFFIMHYNKYSGANSSKITPPSKK